MITYHNIEQCSDEWFDFRLDKMTASHATAIGANGKGLKTYCRQIAAAICGVKTEFITNKDIERGNRLEESGVALYELNKGVGVDLIGSITNDKYKGVSISPDGLVSTNGGLEIKARNDEKHFNLILGDESDVPKNQIQMSLLISEREWWDFASINENLDKQLFMKRLYPDEAYFKKLEAGFITGREMIEQYIYEYKNYKL